MYLKSIQLAGFKSFVDPTTVTIRGNMSAIVGPNGCGKSNIVDAVRWVIGERSAKELRGESMSDVIFNGSAQRQPVGRASIELHFENNTGRIGGEYAKYAEIVVRRELARDGQSHYSINNISVRRRDVLDLFLGTGLGAESYAIIGQGMVSQIIESKPDELRIYVEEAAGISKYKERRRETETRMRHTQENLDRLNDIREELNTQLSHLKRQVSAAERYKSYKQEERLLNAQTKALQWQALDKQFTEQDQLIQQETVLHEAKQSDLHRCETEIEKIRTQLVEADANRSTIQKNYYSLGADIARLEQQICDAQEQKKQWEQDLQLTESSLEELQNNTLDFQTQCDKLTAEVARLQQQTALMQTNAQAAKSLLSESESHALSAETAWENAQTEIANMNSQYQVIQTKIEHYQQQVEQLSRRRQVLQDQIQASPQAILQTEIEPLLSHAAALHEKLTVTQVKLNDYAEAIVAKRNDYYAAFEALQQNRETCQQLETQLAKGEALQQAVFHADDEQVSHAPQGLLQQTRLGQTIQVNPGWEYAVETVLNNYFDAICVDNLEDFIDWLNEVPSGRLTLIEKNILANNTVSPSPRQTLASQVQCDWQLKQWLAHIYIVDSLIEAKQSRTQLQDHESIITRTGLWLGRHWMRIYKSAEAQNNFLVTAHELKKLHGEIATKKNLLQQQEMAVKESEQQLQQLETERDSLHQAYQTVSTETTTVQTQLSTKQTQLADMERAEQQLQQECGTLDLQLSQIKEALAVAIVRQQELTHLQQTLAQQGNLTLENRDQQRAQVKQYREVATLAQKESDELQIRLAAAADQLLLLKQTMMRDERQIEQLTARQRQLLDTESESSIETYQVELQTQLDQRMIVERLLHESERVLENTHQRQRGLENERNIINKISQETQSKIEALRMQRQAISIRQTALEEQLQATDFALPTVIQSLQEAPEVMTLESCALQLEKITQRLERLGPINLAALSEHETTLARKEYLDKQYADLTEALNLLQDAIRKIDRETREKFKETYERLNETFQQLFPKIFGGGAATLETTEADILETGLLVRAQPPGKRNVHIHMLSGGEKALTAIAFIFALFQLNPAPFCILDEVDAPLDDNNVGRFSQLVKEMSQTVQFLVISHNKVTIAAADYLMGVTMQEPGVSRLVSVDMREALALVE